MRSTCVSKMLSKSLAIGKVLLPLAEAYIPLIIGLVLMEQLEASIVQ